MKKLKIGILTYHSEMNYGCTLQAYAMQEAYKEMGQDPIIINRLITSNNSLLLGPLTNKSLRNIIRNIYHCFFTVGRFDIIKRVLKTLSFHKKYLRKTEYSFFDWKDAPEDLDVDMISIGSDQIWNANLYSPIPYLLRDIRKHVPGISYAASIGMPYLMPKYLEEYKEGFKRFEAISVREKEGVKLVEDLGFKAEKVLDPTLLVNPKLWDKFKSKKKYRKKRLLCYTLAENLLDTLPALENFALKHNCDVVLFPDRFEKHFNLTKDGVRDLVNLRIRLLKSPVKIYISAAIKDFMREISASDWIITNSYHALMFSIIYDKDVRIIIPTDEKRKQMHSRMQEIAGSIINGPLMQPDILAALNSFESGEKINVDYKELGNQRAKSKMWLQNQINNIRIKLDR